VKSLVIVLLSLWPGLVLLSAPVYGDDPKAKNPNFEFKTNSQGIRELWITAPDETGTPKSLLAATVETLPQGSVLYHWDYRENAERWARNGFVNEGEVAALNRGKGLVGGGYYISKDIYDSSGFGEALTVFRAIRPAQLLTFKKEDYGYWNRMYPVISDWNAFNQELLKNQVDGIAHYTNETWINLIDAKALENARIANWKDVEQSALFSGSENKLQELLTINQKIPAANTPWLESHYPILSAFLKNQPPAFTQTYSRQWFFNWLDANALATDRSPLTQAMRNYFREDFLTQLKQSWYNANHPSNPNLILGREYVLDGNIALSRRAGIDYSAWLPDIQAPKTLFPNSLRSTNLAGIVEKAPNEGFPATISAHLTYLEFDDFLNAAAKGADITRLYDEPGKRPYLERWLDAGQYLYSDPLDAARMISGSDQIDFRDGPQSSDGDKIIDGQKYFQVTDRQRLALETNPYIQSEFKSFPDPKNPSQTIQYARYQYPTAAQYEKFSSFIRDSTLKSDLEAAKSKGMFTNLGPEHPDIRALTKRMIQEVLKNAMSLPSVTRHRVLTALHPFTAMNTEWLANLFTNYAFQGSKFLYSGLRTRPGKPDDALLYTLEDYFALLYSNADQTAAIYRGLKREELLHSEFPKYFDIPEFWQAARGIQDIGPDPAKFVSESKALFLKQRNCVATRMSQTLGTINKPGAP
jgi:hypothetical protein